MTGTIAPGAVSTLLLRWEEERLNQYIESLEYLIRSRAVTKIIFCENSNYGVKRLEYLQKTARTEGIQLELMSFQGDDKQVGLHGKGYGEGEIMEYILRNSRLIQGEDFFIKITGRMKIDNIKSIVSHLRKDTIYFNVPNHTRRDIYDTRIYAMGIKAFRDNFLREYKNVWDEKGIFLEHIYADIVRKKKLSVKNFPRYPRIRGISGSTGITYEYTPWKCRVKDLLSLFNYYSYLKE